MTGFFLAHSLNCSCDIPRSFLNESSAFGMSSYIISEMSPLDSFALLDSSLNCSCVISLPETKRSTNLSKSSPPIAASILTCSAIGRPFICLDSSALPLMSVLIKSCILDFVFVSSSSNITWYFCNDVCASSAFFSMESLPRPLSHLSHPGVLSPNKPNSESFSRPVEAVALLTDGPYLLTSASLTSLASLIFSLRMSYCSDRS